MQCTHFWTDASKVTDEALKGEVISLVGPGVEFPEELDAAIGEV